MNGRTRRLGRFAFGHSKDPSVWDRRLFRWVIGFGGLAAALLLVGSLVAIIWPDDDESSASRTQASPTTNEPVSDVPPLTGQAAPLTELINPIGFLSQIEEVPEDAPTGGYCVPGSWRSARADAHACMVGEVAFMDPCFIGSMGQQGDDGPFAVCLFSGLIDLWIGPVDVRPDRGRIFDPDDTVASGRATTESMPYAIGLENGEICIWSMFEAGEPGPWQGANGIYACGVEGVFSAIGRESLELAMDEGLIVVLPPPVAIDIAFDVAIEGDGAWTVLYGSQEAETFSRVPIATVYY